MTGVKEFIGKLSDRCRAYLERKLRRKAASVEPKEPLLTGQPVEGEGSRGKDATRLPSPVSPFGVRGWLTPIPLIPLPRSGLGRLTVRNPTEGRSRDSQETIAVDPRPPPNTSSPTTVGRFAFETSEAGSDNITPAPPLFNRTESGVSAASTADANFDSEGHPVNCYVCGKFFGEKAPHTNEKVAYLPCGHAFGHNCLFIWLSKANGLRRCPILPCVPTRHKCEHITVPTTAAPAKKFLDTTVPILPWDYEFCSSPKGVRLQQSIRENFANVTRMNAQKSRGETSATDFTFDTRLKFYTSRAEQMEKKLDTLHKDWWAAQWESFGKEKQQPAWSWQRMRGGDRAGSSSTSP